MIVYKKQINNYRAAMWSISSKSYW